MVYGRHLMLFCLILVMTAQVATAAVVFPVTLVCGPAEGNLPIEAESNIAALAKQNIQFNPLAENGFAGLAGIAVLWMQISDGNTLQPGERAAIAQFVQAGGALVLTPAPGAGEPAFRELNMVLATVKASARLVAKPALPPAQTQDALQAWIGIQAEGLASIYLHNPIPIEANKQAVPILRSDNANSQELVWGVMERVGKGYVTVLGAAMLSQDVPSDQDNLPFLTALITWLYERAAMCLNLPDVVQSEQ